MMFYKPLVSLVVAFAAASSVAAAAAAAPEARGGKGGKSDNKCSSGSAVCCDTVTNSKDPAFIGFAFVGSLDPNLLDGLNCASIASGGNCNTNQLCCQNVQQGFGLNCNQVNVNL